MARMESEVKRTYGQYCGMARALEMVGERWALLIIRDLFVGPRRFTDLLRGLPRIPTNVLTTRLKELEDAGVVQRRALPRPATGVVYELTEYGRELEEVVLRLARWGAQSLGDRRPGEIVTADSMIMALRTTFHPEAARDLQARYELHFGDVVIHAHIADGTLAAAPGPLPAADLVLIATAPLKPMLAGEISPEEAIERGFIRIDGPLELLVRFVEIFRIHPAASIAAP
jgi:DNA-binding HxlR family transcriptional regulator